MPLTESKSLPNGRLLPEGIWRLLNEASEVRGFRARWEERDENGVRRRPARNFRTLDARARV